MINITTAQTDADILKCWPVLHLLRPHLKQETFLPLIRQMMQEGYELAFIEMDGTAAAAIGFRYLRKLYDGKQIYVDDLSTLEACRGKGYAGMLLDHVFGLARANGCACITLDSGPSRHDAHRLYLNKRFRISSLHFSRGI